MIWETKRVFNFGLAIFVQVHHLIINLMKNCQVPQSDNVHSVVLVYFMLKELVACVSIIELLLMIICDIALIFVLFH